MIIRAKAIVEFDSKGETGNIYYILGRVRREMAKERLISGYNDLQERVYKAGNYVEALSIIREYINLIDTSGEC